jgi:DNA-binding transcriptional ArsR family regulator
MTLTVATSVDLETLARVGEALANPIRRVILVELLGRSSAYPGDLADEIGTTRQILSNHLACLRGCGFVSASTEGRRVRYELAGPDIADALTRLGSLDLGPCSQDATP